jgi:uncharacterized lipoprotein YajG
MNYRLPLVLVCAVFLSGCALSEDVVSIPYTAQGGPQTGAGIVVTADVVDARIDDRNRVSVKVNGYGMEMAAIRADRAVTAILNDALTAELKSRGYTVQPGGNTVRIAVKKFFNAFKVGIFSGDANADVQLAVTVTAADGRQVYQRDINVVGNVANIQLASGSNAAEALADGMKRAFAMLFADPAFIAALAPAGASPAPAPASTNS